MTGEVQLEINTMTDGHNHINIYSKGRTELGRQLTNFARTPFVYPDYGEFQSVEGFWYYYLTGCQHEHLKSLYGYEAKKAGQKLRNDRLDKDGLTDSDKQVILEAIRCKLRQNRSLLSQLKESTLPFKHYYAYGDHVKGYRVVFTPEYDWIVDEIERLRVLLKK